MEDDLYGRRVQPGYALMLLVSIGLTLGALATLAANPQAATVNLLGYRGVSSLAPITTVVLLACAFVNCKLRVRFFVR